jgi:hypothetical protein
VAWLALAVVAYFIAFSLSDVRLVELIFLGSNAFVEFTKKEN